MTFEQVMERVANLLDEAQNSVPTGSEDSNKPEIYVNIADRWLHYAHILNDRDTTASARKLLEERYRSGDQIPLDLVAPVPEPENKGAYR